MSKVSKNDVEYVSELAHLRLDEEAKERVAQEMSKVLIYMDKLNELDTEDIEPMMHAMEIANVYREDEVGPSLPREVVLRTAPLHDNEYFIVPKILDKEG